MATILDILFASAVNGTAYDVTSYIRVPHGPDALDALNPYVVATEQVEISGGLLTVKDGNDNNWSLAGVSFGSFGSEDTNGFWDATQGCATILYTFTTGALDDVGTGPLLLVQKEELDVDTPYPLRLTLEDNADSPQTFTLRLIGQGWDATIEDTTVTFTRAELEGIATSVRAEWQCGTPTLSSPGFSDVAHDGFIRIYWNGVLILNKTNVDLFISQDQDGPNWANGFSVGYFGLMGTVSRVTLNDTLCGASSSERNLLTGQGHSVTGSDNLMSGADGTLIGDLNVLHNLDETPRTRTKSNYFGVFADEIELVGDTVTIEGLGFGGGSVSAIDVERIHRALQGLAIYSGCQVTEDNTGASMDVDVSAGHIRLTTGVGLLVTAGEVTLDAAHATLDRIDLVWVNTSGTLGETAGTPAATPVPPDIPANSILLAMVSVPATDTTISNAQITDKRTYTKLPQFARKTADESVTNTTLQDDDDLEFTIGASEVWTADFVLYPEGTTTGDIKMNIAVPAGATYRMGGVGTIVTAAGNDGDGRFLTTAGSGFDLTFGMIGAANRVPIFLKALVINSTTPGLVTLRWAENSTDATATKMQAFSSVEARPAV